MASALADGSLPIGRLAAATQLPARPHFGPSARLEQPARRVPPSGAEGQAGSAAGCIARSVLPAAVGLAFQQRAARRRSAATASAAPRGRGCTTCKAASSDEVRASRRSLLSAPFAAAASQAAAVPPAFAERLATLTPEDLGRAKGKVAVITGATAGVGLEAARTLLANGGDVYVTGRTLEKAKAAVADITQGAPSGAGRAVPMELNLASLASVRRFAEQWGSEVKRPIDILAANGGLALAQDLKEPQLTEDGFELTVGTNHLGHFLLVNLLLNQLSPTARVVVTASSVHNPATGDPGAQATLGNLSGLGPSFGKGGAAMVDGGPFDAQKAYKDSKLCNVLFTLELARRLKKQGSQVTVNCLSPGLIPSPTFFRYQPSGFSGVFAFAATNVLKIAETTQFGGDTLCFMALDSSLDGKSGLFYSAVPPGKHVFVENTPSEEARNEAEAAELWTKSAALVGL